MAYPPLEEEGVEAELHRSHNKMRNVMRRQCIPTLLKDMQTALENFIKVGDNTESNINNMRVAQAKSVALFNRKIKEITEGK